jgi:hypothetical protein
LLYARQARRRGSIRTSCRTASGQRRCQRPDRQGQLPVDASLSNPALVAAAALVTGAVFGFVSERLGNALTFKRDVRLN